MTAMGASVEPSVARPTQGDRIFVGLSALVLVASMAVTIVWCRSMAAMGGMPMPGGWAMSMMLPSLAPALLDYRARVGGMAAAPLGHRTVLVALGYFAVWMAFGVAAYPIGAAFTTLTMQQPAVSRAVPTATAAVVLIAGALQITAWKARRLACCRHAPGDAGALPRDAGDAWRLGVRLGIQCARCCGNLMAILLVAGVMDLTAMGAVTVAITLERVAPGGQRVARVLGLGLLAAGALLLARAGANG
jgi:predicted metal-binding membrane protein